MPRNRNTTIMKHKKTTPKPLPTIAQQTTINFKKTLTPLNLRCNLTTSTTVTKATYSKLSNNVTAITKGLKTKIGKVKLSVRFLLKSSPLTNKPTNHCSLTILSTRLHYFFPLLLLFLSSSFRSTLLLPLLLRTNAWVLSLIQTAPTNDS